MIRRPPRSTLFPSRRSSDLDEKPDALIRGDVARDELEVAEAGAERLDGPRHHDGMTVRDVDHDDVRSEEHTSELQSRQYLVCRLLLEKKQANKHHTTTSYPT